MGPCANKGAHKNDAARAAKTPMYSACLNRRAVSMQTISKPADKLVMQNTNPYPASLSHVAPGPMPVIDADGTRCRVLAIDDSPDMLRLLNAYLNDPRIKVTIARNG